MDQDKFSIFFNCFDEAFLKLTSRITGIHFNPSDHMQETAEKKISVIIGVVGYDQGRVHIDMFETLAKKLYENEYGEPPGDDMDLCYYLAEFGNIVAGSGITLLNNTLHGTNLRVTPPAVFTGKNLEITTHKLQSVTKFFDTTFGSLRMEIGFEGV